MGIRVNLCVFRQNKSIKWFCIFDQIWYEIISKQDKKKLKKVDWYVSTLKFITQ